MYEGIVSINVPIVLCTQENFLKFAFMLMVVAETDWLQWLHFSCDVLMFVTLSFVKCSSLDYLGLPVVRILKIAKSELTIHNYVFGKVENR